ncbi:MAG TPA: hypothetical protein VFU90_03525, partial [Candidatus Tumulicola sp.]|nr:hypothetical protein [Candidatus Tumulicola sp.]
MNLAHFLLWTLLGSLVFCSGLIVVGYTLGDHLDAILPLLHRGGVIVAVAAVELVVAAIVVVRMRARKRARPQRAAEGDS